MQRNELEAKLKSLVEANGNLSSEEKTELTGKLLDLAEVCSENTSVKDVGNLVKTNMQEAKPEHQDIYTAAGKLLVAYVSAIRPETPESSSTSMLTRELSKRSVTTSSPPSPVTPDTKEEDSLATLTKMFGIHQDSIPTKPFYEKMANLLTTQPQDAAKVAEHLKEALTQYNVLVDQTNAKFPGLNLTQATAATLFNAVERLKPDPASKNLPSLLEKIKKIDFDQEKLPLLSPHYIMPDITAEANRIGKSYAEKIDQTFSQIARSSEVEKLIQAAKNTKASPNADNFKDLLKHLCKTSRSENSDAKLLANIYINEIYRDICRNQSKEFNGGAYNVLFAIARQDASPAPTTPTPATRPKR